MGPEIIVIFIIFSTFFGIAYLYFTTRNKERMALIEKGEAADLFVKKKRGRAPVALRYLLISASLIATGIGAGVFLGSILSSMGVDHDTAYPGSIFMLSGLGLFFGFTIAKRMDDKESDQE